MRGSARFSAFYFHSAEKSEEKEDLVSKKVKNGIILN